MRTLSLGFVTLLSTALAAAPHKAPPCIGPVNAQAHAIYLHGLTPPDQDTAEERKNLAILERLAQDLSLRMALPRGPLCPSGKLCWPARDRADVLKTFQAIREQAQRCWTGQPDYSLIGFSNGGYFALKLYKAHSDPRLIHIIASGSAGTWDTKADRAHPSSRFALMIGQKDITANKAAQLAGLLQKAIPGFRFETFPGGHHLDEKTLKSLLAGRSP